MAPRQKRVEVTSETYTEVLTGVDWGSIINMTSGNISVVISDTDPGTAFGAAMPIASGGQDNYASLTGYGLWV